MKKTYQKPAMEVVNMDPLHLCAGSGQEIGIRDKNYDDTTDEIL